MRPCGVPRGPPSSLDLSFPVQPGASSPSGLLRRNGLSPGPAWHMRCCEKRASTQLPALESRSRPLSRPPLSEVDAMNHVHRLGILAACALALSGCGKTSSLQAPSGGGPNGSDDAAVSSALQQNPDFVNEPWSQDETPTSYDEARGFGAIQPLRFWRRITLVESDIHIDYSHPDPDGRPTLAIATVK